MDEHEILQKSTVSRRVMILTVIILVLIVALIVLLPYYADTGEVPGVQQPTATGDDTAAPGPAGPPPPPDSTAPAQRE